MTPTMSVTLSLALVVTSVLTLTSAFARHSELVTNTHKTCPPGYELLYDRSVRKYECQCKKYHLYWPEDGLCYREYHQGPCPEGHR